jgi:hypothetical protein
MAIIGIDLSETNIVEIVNLEVEFVLILRNTNE